MIQWVADSVDKLNWKRQYILEILKQIKREPKRHMYLYFIS
jgi:hypothetical protein